MSVRLYQCVTMFLVLLSIIAVCSAQIPTRCQSPAQWEGRRFREDRKEKYAQLAMHSQDETNRRTRSIEEVFQGDERSYYDTLHLYNENKQYRLDLRTKKCNVTAINHPWRTVGVPPNARFLFEAEIGPAQIPNEHLTATSWEGEFEDGGKIGYKMHSFNKRTEAHLIKHPRYYVTVTYPDCIPMTFDVINNKTDETYHERYFDVHGGITNPSAFIPPSECAGL